jgi:hypothetical protein
MVFYAAMVQVLYGTGTFPQQDLANNRALGGVWHDYGCAEGDGLAYLHTVFPGCDLKGFDTAPTAIAKAKARWPTLEFALGNVTDPTEEADIISTIHTLEHVEYPIEALRQLTKKAGKLVIAITPVITTDSDGGHIGAMLTEDYNTEVSNNFDVVLHTTYLTYRRIEDIEEGEPTIMHESNNLWIIKGNA